MKVRARPSSGPHPVCTGHKTLSEIERYCRDAEKKRLAESATGKVVAMFGNEKEK
jgi:hypothetical protein